MKIDNRTIPLYLKDDPKNPNNLYKYAFSLYKSGDKKEAKIYFQKAAQLGHPHSQEIISKMKKVKRKRILYDLLILICILLFIFALSFLIYYNFSENKSEIKNNDFYMELFTKEVPLKNEISDFQSETLTNANLDKSINQSHESLDKKVAGDSPKIHLNSYLLYDYQKNTSFDLNKINKNTLELMVVHSSLQNYKELHNEYPKKIEQLSLDYPNNYLSYIPNGIDYEILGKSYILKHKNEELFSTEREKISLHFYPSDNQLFVFFGEVPLASYPVASGKESLPFKSTKVSERVVNPNGGKSAVGTRGLVLEDDFAIHGTNNPSSIGKYISLGCIRLNNADIETLYPYISLGTTFIVEEGQTPTPLLKDGLPTLNVNRPNNNDSDKNELNNNDKNEKSKNKSNNTPSNPSVPNGEKCECNPNKTYHWKS